MRALRWAVVVGLIVVGIVTAAIVIQRWPRPIPVATAETVVVYSPHPDDETYSMGQAIAEQSLAGHHVVGVLLTDGEGSGEVPLWVESAGVDMDDDGDVDKWDFGLARRVEYTNAMEALGADELVFMGGSESQGVAGFRDGDLTSDADEVSTLIESIVASVAPSGAVAHMSVAKLDKDNWFESEPREHPDHTVLSNAVRALASDRGEEVYLYKTYVFYGDYWWNRWATQIVRGTDDALARKREAIEAFTEIGRASTDELWESSYESDVEYLGVAEGP